MSPLRRQSETGRWPALPGDRLVRTGAALVLTCLVCALAADWIAPGDPGALGPATESLQAPDRTHPLGTDSLGRDVLARLVHGCRTSLIVGWVGALVAVFCGGVVGLLAGLAPRAVDRALMAVTDLFLAVPRILLVLLLVAVSRPSLLLVIVVLGLTGWMGVARLVRAEVLSLREREFVAAARGLGLHPVLVAWRHVLPHVLPTLVVAVTLRIGNVILLESFLGYLGLGAQEPLVSWGSMIQQGAAHLRDAWWLALFPGLAVTLAAVGHNLIGDGLRDLLDPRARRKGGDRDGFPAA